MKSKADQEVGDIWFHKSFSETYMLVEQLDSFSMSGCEKPTTKWKTYCFETGSFIHMNFNSSASDYDVWSFLG